MKITDELVDTCAIASINDWRENEGLRPVGVEDLEHFVGAEAVRAQTRAILTAALDTIAVVEEAAVRAGWNRARNLTLALDGPDIKDYPYKDGSIGLSLD